MTVDVASLVFEIDSRQAEAAEQRLEKLIVTSDRLEASARKVKTATEMAGIGLNRSAAGTRAAAKAATELATSEGAVERATRSAAAASSATRAQRALEAAAMRELAQAARAYERDQARTKAAVDALRMSVDPLRAAVARVNAEIAEANRLHSIGAINAVDHAQALSVLNARIATMNDVQMRGARSAKGLQLAGLDLSRQFADIGVTAAMGMNPLMILIQQGPQIADRMAMMKMEGIGLAAVLKSMGAAIAPMLPVLLAVAAAAAVVAGAFALFEREVDKNTKGATTWGDTWRATVNVIGKAIMEGPIGDALRWLGEGFSMAMDSIVNGAMTMLDRFVGFWGAAFSTIVTHWRQFPQVLGALFVGAVNIAIEAIEGLVNAGITGLNRIGKVVGWSAIGEIDLPRVKQANNAVAADFEQTRVRIEASFRAAREGAFAAIVKETERLAAARQKDGKAATGQAAATDESTRALEELHRALETVIQSLETPFERALRESREKMLVLRAAFEAGIISGERFADLIGRMFPEQAVKAANDNVELVRTVDELASASERMAERGAGAFQQMADAARQIGFALDDVKYSLKSGDWVGAASGMVNAFKSIQAAYAQGGIDGGTTAAAGAAGAMIGGRVGGALSGAAMGAQLGTMVMPGIGTAVGAVLGGIAGLFGGGNSKKKEQREAAERAAQAEADRQLRILTEARNQEIAILQLSGRDVEALALQRKYELEGIAEENRARQQAIYDLQDKAAADAKALTRRAMEASLLEAQSDAVGALAIRRADELAALEESLRPLQQAIWAQEDLNDAMQKAAQIAATRTSLEIQLMRAQGNAAGALAAERALEIAALDPSLHALQRLVWAEQDLAAVRNAAQADIQTAQQAVETARGVLTEAYNRESQALQGTIDKFKSFADSLAAFRRQLFTGPEAMRSPAGQNEATASEFRRLSSLPAGSEERLGSIQGAAEAFLAASLARAPDAAAYNRDLQEVRRIIADSEKAARSEVDVATRQLDALNASVAGLLTVNQSVLSVRDAIAGLQGALGALATAQGRADALDPTKPAGDTFADYVRGNADILAAYNAYGAARGQSMADFGKQHWASTGFQEGRAVTPGFATGGSFDVVGPPSGDQVPVSFRANGGEHVNISRQDSMAEMAEEIRGLRLELARIAKSTDQTQSELKNMQGNGLFVRGRSPDDPVRTDEAA